MVRVSTERDVGTDGFVQITVGGVPTGQIFGVQVKAGTSYARSTGYSVPVGSHTQAWKDATVPCIAIVFDPIDESLWWANATEALRGDPDRTAVRVESRLPDPDSEADELLRSIRLSSRLGDGLPTALGSPKLEEGEDVVWQCFGMGFQSPNALIALRRSMFALTEPVARASVVALSHCTPHPDIYWTDRNSLPKETRTAVSQELRWSSSEALALIKLLGDEWTFDRGTFGQCVYMVLVEDPGVEGTMYEVAVRTAPYDLQSAQLAALVAINRSLDPPVLWQHLRASQPLLKHGSLGREIEATLQDFGWIELW